jgi:hypothetical protein
MLNYTNQIPQATQPAAIILKGSLKAKVMGKTITFKNAILCHIPHTVFAVTFH